MPLDTHADRTTNGVLSGDPGEDPMEQEEQTEWLRHEKLAETSGPAAARTAAMFELRPLSLGEILDRTFALYRSRFWLFASITAVSASVQVVVQAISLTAAHALMRGAAAQGTIPVTGLPLNHHLLGMLLSGRVGVSPMPMRGFLTAQIGTWVAALLFFLVSAVIQAATSLAMSQVYLSQPASAKEALAVAARRWYRWIAIAFWQIGSMLWIPLVGLIPGALLMTFGAREGNRVLVGIGILLLLIATLGGVPAGFILYLRNTLAVPAAVVERLTIRAAMRRSKVLAAGTKGRIFVVLLIAGCLYYVVAILESPATLLIMFAPRQEHYIAQAISLVVSFLGHTVVAPVALIGLTLVYFDQRVRKEALDLQLLLDGSRGVPAAESAALAAQEGFAPLV